MDVHEHIVLNDMERCVKQEERLGQLARDLAAARQQRRGIASVLVTLMTQLAPTRFSPR